MKRVLIATLLLGLLSLAVGCGDGVAITSRERQERHRRIIETDWKQLNDDWDSFWLMDRPGRLTWSRVE